MTLPEGFRLGPYEILAPIGAGGMGEVCRGFETQVRSAIERDNALKLFPRLRTA